MSKDVVYRLCTFAQRGSLRIFADLKAEGQENVPLDGPLIIVANHQSSFDPALLAPIIPRRLRFLAKDSLFRNFVAEWFLRSWGAVPLNREAIDIKATRWTLSHLANGGTLMLFPEGTRNLNGMGQAQPGIAQIAIKSRATLLPVGITGTAHLGTWLRALNPTGTLRVKIGAPFNVPEIKGRPTPEDINAVTELMMGRIASLLPESYRGIYSHLAEDALEGTVAAPPAG